MEHAGVHAGVIDPFATGAYDHLATPLAWTDAQARIAGCNLAFARWLGVGARRLHGLPLASLEADGEGLPALLEDAAAFDAPRLLRRIALAFPGGAPAFADITLSARADGGWLLEAHPVAEIPGEDPAQLLSAALKGLAHELRNPLAGLKGAAQLLARRVDEARELVGG